jgi:hypothetical protein
MGHTGIFATAAECGAMAGELIDATGWVEANINSWCLQAESYLNVLSNFNFSDNFASLNADVKYILAEYEARYCAMCGIAYNMITITNRVVAEDMIMIHWSRMQEIETILTKQENVTYMDGA